MGLLVFARAHRTASTWIAASLVALTAVGVAYRRGAAVATVKAQVEGSEARQKADAVVIDSLSRRESAAALSNAVLHLQNETLHTENAVLTLDADKAKADVLTFRKRMAFKGDSVVITTADTVYRYQLPPPVVAQIAAERFKMDSAFNKMERDRDALARENLSLIAENTGLRAEVGIDSTEIRVWQRQTADVKSEVETLKKAKTPLLNVYHGIGIGAGLAIALLKLL
jgi:hypothetical protein